MFSQIPEAPDGTFSQVCAPYRGLFSQIPTAPGDCNYPSLEEDVSFGFGSSQISIGNLSQTLDKINSTASDNEALRQTSTPVTQKLCPVKKRQLFHPPLQKIIHQDTKKVKLTDTANKLDRQNEKALESKTPRKNLGDLHMWETPASDQATNTRGYTPSPLVLQHGIHEGVKLKSVTELPEKYRPVFSFPFFNVVQSKVFDEVFYSDKPVVLCAPTGAGKTVIFELAIIRMIMKLEVTQMQNNYKVVYMAPIKALCRERFVDWQQKFTCYGMKCQELTGDSDIDDYNQLQDVNMIFTTPEKWDSMTRKWRDNKFLVQSVSLFLVDEIHMLNDSTRGSTIEAVVSRMKTIQQALSRSMSNSPNPQLRFIAVSATIPNIIDVAHWLGDGENPATHFKLDESYRPVVLRKVILGFPYNENKGSEFRFDLTLSYRLMGIINTYSERKPTLVFCSTRKSTQQAAEILVKDSNGMYVRSTDQRQILLTNANMLKDNKLRDLVMKGVGYHHAGLDIHDRKIMEDLFSEGNLSVLVATSTLAMGVNLPAHLVIVKSTVHYNMGVHVAYSDSEILQMIGRAGRPQFDTSATAVIMTKSQDKYKYDSLVNGTQLIESSLHKNLIEHLNAEIVLHTINDISIAMEWIRYTFLYIRIMKNPRHYGMPPDCQKEEIERRLQDLCMRCLNQLNSLHLITMDEESIDVKPTEAGRLMARYCIAYETMKKFSTIAGTESINDLLKIISSSEEFCEIQLRINEKKTLNMLNNDKNRQTIRYQFPGKIKTKQMKVNCLIQAALGCLMVQDFSLQQETNRIFRVGQRVTRCLVEFLWMRDNYKAVLSAIHLNKCLRARLWEDSKYVTKQLEGIGPAMSNALVNAGIDSFQKIEEKNPRELELIVNRHPPFGNQLRDSVSYLPKYELTIDQVAKYGESCSEIIINISIANAEKVQQGKTTSDYHMCMLLIGDEDNHVVFRRKIMDTHLIKDGGFTKKIEVSRAANGPDLNIDFISQEWVGIDVQCRYTPIYLGGTKRIANTVRKDQQCSSVKGSNQAVPVRELDEGREECNHRCVNKAMCGHECCKHGIVKKAVTTKSLVRTPSVNRAKFMDSYVSDLKNKIQPMPETPRISTKINTMRDNVIDLTKFAYYPSDRMSWQISDERQPKTPSALDMFYSNRLNQNSVNKSEVRAPITPHNTTTGRITDDSWVKLDLFMRGRDRGPVELSDEEENGPTVYSDRYEDNDYEENGYEGDDIGDFDLQSSLFPMRQSNLEYRGTLAQNVHSAQTAARDTDCLSDLDNSLPKLVRGPNKSHRYGKVVAWSNSQEAVGDEFTGDWSGSDNDLITAEQQLSQSYNSGTQDGHSKPIVNTSEHQIPQSYNSRTLEGQSILVQNIAKQPQVNVSRSDRQQTKPSNTDNSVHKSSGFTNSSDTFMTDYKWNNNCCSNSCGNLQKQQNYPQIPLSSSVKSTSSVCSVSESRTKDTAYMASLSNERLGNMDHIKSHTSKIKNTNALLPDVSSKNFGFQGRLHVDEIENQDSLYNNDHVEPATMKQSNIMQYGRLVKKPVYKASINSPVSSRSVKRGSFTSFFTDCFTGADEVPNDSAVGDDGLDTFDSIFDGIF